MLILEPDFTIDDVNSFAEFPWDEFYVDELQGQVVIYTRIGGNVAMKINSDKSFTKTKHYTKALEMFIILSKLTEIH